jgi:hypothetical protein
MADVGVNGQQSTRWQAIASVNEETFEQYIADAKESGSRD